MRVIYRIIPCLCSLLQETNGIIAYFGDKSVS